MNYVYVINIIITTEFINMSLSVICFEETHYNAILSSRTYHYQIRLPQILNFVTFTSYLKWHYAYKYT